MSARKHCLGLIIFTLVGVSSVAYCADIIQFEKFVRPDGPWGRQPIILEDGGGFSNILIAIHPDVQDSEFVIEHIQGMFQNASHLLFGRRKQYFKNISILVPDKWNPKPEYIQARPNETLETARFIIRNETSDSEPSQVPFVRRYYGCDEGEYIYLPYGSLSSNNATVITQHWDQFLGHRTENCISVKKVDISRKTGQDVAMVTPHIRLIQKREELSVIILDAREHMKENDKFTRMMEKYSDYIWHLFPTYSWLGVVTAPVDESITVPCYKIWEKPSFRARYTLPENTPKIANGTSRIGDSVEKAIELLKERRDDISGSRIFIMSDGADNDSSLNDVKDRVIEAGVILASLPYSHNISENIELNYTINPNFTVTLLDKMIRLEDPQRYSRIHLSGVKEVTNAANLSIRAVNFNPDYSNQYVIVRIQCSDVYSLNVSGCGDYCNMMYDGEMEMAEKLWPSAPLDEIYIASEVKQNISVEVYSALIGPFRKFEENNPNRFLQARAVLKTPIVNFTTLREGVLLVSAFSVNERPVSNVSIVEAHVTFPGGIMNTIIPLKDDGIGADDKIDDGAYSGYFTNLSLIEGEYSFMAYAQNDGEACLIKSSSTHETECDPIQMFNQYTGIQTFTLFGIPPSPITNLTVTQMGERKSRLEWTASGEDFMTGRAAGYDVRFSEHSTVLEKDFASAMPVTMETTISGTVPIPQEAGSRESMEVLFNSDLPEAAEYFVGIRAFDNSGNLADTSVVVKVSFYEIKENITTTTTTTTIVEDVKTPPSNISFIDTVKATLKQTHVIVAICIIGILVLCVILYLFKTYTKDRQLPSNVAFKRPLPSKVTPLSERKCHPVVDFVVVEDF